MAKSRKSLWTQAYDEALLQVMKDLGIETCHQLPTDHSWSNIQRHLTDILARQQETKACSPQFSTKQCRDRWLNHLAPGIVKGNWSQEEKQIIIGMASSNDSYTFKDIAANLPGRPCADVKNMYHSLVRSGKIKRNNDKPPRAALDRTRMRQEKQQQQQQQSESSAVDGNHNKRKSDKSSPEQKKKKYRKSGIPLEGAPPFASPNTTNAARVLMSLDMTSNNSWPGAASDVATELVTDKHLVLHDKEEGTSTSTVSALPATIDHAVPESESNTFCRVHIVNSNYGSSGKERDAEKQQQQHQHQLVGFVTLPSTCLTFAQARTVLQTELLAHSKLLLQYSNSSSKNATMTTTTDWSFTVPGQGRLTAEQEDKLRVDFLCTPETLGTVFSPLHVTIEVAAISGDDPPVAAAGTETTMTV